MVHDVADIRANKNENITHAAEVIGRSKVRRIVFEAIYKGKSLIKTVSEIMRATSLNQVQVLQQGAILNANQLVEKIKVSKETGYKKIAFFSNYKSRILRIVDNPKLANKLPTKQRPRISKGTIKVSFDGAKPKTKRIYIDDIDSFKLVRKVRKADDSIKLNHMREEVIKCGLLKIIGENRRYKDWGGEKSDFYTSKLIYKGKRISAACALKGKATQGILTPKKMGHNGDQIARLLTVAAQVFFIVYHSEVDESVIAQLQIFALGKALSGQKIYYCVIDGSDLNRLVQAYRNSFKIV